MKPTHWLALILAAMLGGGVGFVLGRLDGTERPVVEGVIYSVEYQRRDGSTEGLTRSNSSKMVPGGNGSWNMDMHGKLYHDFLIITFARHKDGGSNERGGVVIPFSRLVSVEFGDGGIKAVSQTTGP
jgi:hypothetical protein